MLSILKAFGKKDTSKLVRKQITDKKGVRRTVWVKKEEVKEESKERPGLIRNILGFFGFSKIKELRSRIEDDYNSSGIQDISLEEFEDVYFDYFANKDKYDSKLKPKPKTGKDTIKNTEEKEQASGPSPGNWEIDTRILNDFVKGYKKAGGYGS